MAKKTTTYLVDDITGGPASRTVRFGLLGKNYEIDLSETGAKQLEEALAPYIKAGRSAGKARSVHGIRPDAPKIRAWAKAQGYVLSDRGRIPRPMVEAYDARGGA